jgi:alcohol dehydrogenase class IV
VIVRWGLPELPGTLQEVGIERPFVIATDRWRTLELPAHTAWLSEVPSERPAVPPESDGILAVGGGSAVDTGKHASAQTGLPVVHVPTTYSGAEWTTFFGIRSPDRRIQGSGAGAHPVALVYDVDLTLDLPRAESVGTALNALAHCAEALYVAGRSAEGDEQAVAGAQLIARWLPRVAADGSDREAREALLRGAAHAGHALGLAGLGLGHAMAQALGGTYGLPHGAMNALCLPPALAFNRGVVPAEVARFGEAVGGDPVERSRELAALGDFGRLRDFGIPHDDLPAVADAAAQRAGNAANPRPATPVEIKALLESIW